MLGKKMKECELLYTAGENIHDTVTLELTVPYKLNIYLS